MANQQYAGDLSPAEAWAMLEADPQAVLVDVRTDAEWAYVGLPDLSALDREPQCVPWVEFPAMARNAAFTNQVAEIAATDAPVLFLCRSGVRSRNAAITLTQAGFTRCYNIEGGFEGDKDDDGHRGRVNGWKVAGLPWVQG